MQVAFEKENEDDILHSVSNLARPCGHGAADVERLDERERTASWRAHHINRAPVQRDYCRLRAQADSDRHCAGALYGDDNGRQDL